MISANTIEVAEHKFLITMLFGVSYFSITGLWMIYYFIFAYAANPLLQIVNSVPLSGESFLFFFQGLLIFCSILFGFYALIFMQAVSKLQLVLRKYVEHFSLKYRMHMFLGALFILLLLVPPYYLFEAVTSSLEGTIGYSYVTNSFMNNTITNYTLSGFHEIATKSTTYTYTAGWWIFIVLILYTFVELGIAEWFINDTFKLYGNKILNWLKT
ncbi:MAG: hypothetical protein M1286_03200 [Candidatus Marsarchaeota archaeon]|nr:hypothetical protein [Candidatus Marsarchaeota archaeon]